MTEIQMAIDNAIKEDWELVKDTAGTGSSREAVFDLAYRFGWHAARKYARRGTNGQAHVVDPIHNSPQPSEKKEMITNFVKTIIEHHIKHIKDQIDADQKYLTELEAKANELRAKIASNQSVASETEAWLSTESDERPLVGIAPSTTKAEGL